MMSNVVLLQDHLSVKSSMITVSLGQKCKLDRYMYLC